MEREKGFEKETFLLLPILPVQGIPSPLKALYFHHTVPLARLAGEAMKRPLILSAEAGFDYIRKPP